MHPQHTYTNARGSAHAAYNHSKFYYIVVKKKDEFILILTNVELEEISFLFFCGIIYECFTLALDKSFLVSTCSIIETHQTKLWKIAQKQNLAANIPAVVRLLLHVVIPYSHHRRLSFSGYRRFTVVHLFQLFAVAAAADYYFRNVFYDEISIAFIAAIFVSHLAAFMSRNAAIAAGRWRRSSRASKTMNKWQRNGTNGTRSSIYCTHTAERIFLFGIFFLFFFSFPSSLSSFIHSFVECEA